MADEAPPRPIPVPAVIRSDADYRRVMERLAEIAEGIGKEPEKGEFAQLLIRAEGWEERVKR